MSQLSDNFSSSSFPNPPPKSVITCKSLVSFCILSTNFSLNSLVVLTVHLAPCLINAFEIIAPDVIPSQSICVVTKIFFLALIASEIRSEKLDNDSSKTFPITLTEPLQTYISIFDLCRQFSCSELIVCELWLQPILELLHFCYPICCL